MAPSSSTPPSSNKLLTTDSNPKSRPKLGPSAAPPNSASSSSTTTAPPPPEKKTRDQPNFSDCHCCGRRINSTNPKDRLQPLDSVWRIVLLCRKCRRNVRSGQTCPYCFRGTGNSGDFLTCGVCERKIHRDCVRSYGNCTPWCYLGVGSEGFRVCVDCWVPELLKNSIRVCGSENKVGLSKKYLLENVVKNGKGEVEKKVKSRAKVGKNDALYFSSKKDKDSSEAENSNCDDSIEVVDDAELAIQLHRAMNSSPRILRPKCSVKNSSDLDVSNIRDWNGLSYKRSRLGKNRDEDKKLGTCGNIAENELMNLLGENDSYVDSTGLNLGLQCYKRDKSRKIWQLNEDNTVVSESKTRCSISNGVGIPEASVCVYADQNNVDRFGQELVSYRRSRFKRKLFQVNGPVGGSEESSSLDDQGAACKPECCQIDGAEVILPSGSCDSDRDRYHLKYGKRNAGTKPDSSFLRCSTLLSQNQTSHHALNNSGVGFDKDRERYHLKYAKRATGTKYESSFLRYNALLSENRASAPVLKNSAVGCSVESDGKLILQIGTVNPDPDRYCFKYTKRVKISKSGSISETKLHSGAFLKGIEASAAGLTMNCSAESRTLSDVTFDSFTVAPPK